MLFATCTMPMAIDLLFMLSIGAGIDGAFPFTDADFLCGTGFAAAAAAAALASAAAFFATVADLTGFKCG